MPEEAGAGDPSLKFINIAGEPSRVTKDDAIRKLVRTNASQSVQREKAAPIDKAGLPVTARLHSGRSRFALSSRKPMKRAGRGAAAKGLPNKGARHGVTQATSACGSQQNGISRVPQDLHRHRGEASLQVIPRYFGELSLSNWIPLKTKPNVGTMLQYLFNQLVDCHHDSSETTITNFEVFATRDQALFHAGLSIASVYYDTGTSNLFHCQETLKLVSRRLSDYYMQTSDETIGAVGLLVIHDTLTGTTEHSTLHMNGLERMVDARGGLHSLPIRLRRTLSMIDTFYATTRNCRPRFPFVHPPKDLASTLSDLPSLWNCDLKLLQLLKKPGRCLETREVLQVLRILTAVRFADPVSVFNRLALSDAIYLLEWQLFRPREPQIPSPTWSLGTDIQEPFHIATVLYIDMVLREMRGNNIGGLVHRLAESTQTIFQADSSQALAGHLHGDVVVWTFFVGGVASQDPGERSYFVRVLSHICRERGICSNARFEEAVDAAGPALQSFSKQIAELWDEITFV